MENIEYRAWSPNHGHMFYQSQIDEEGDFHFQVTPVGLKLITVEESWSCGSGEWVSYDCWKEQPEAKFMQYTGLKYTGNSLSGEESCEGVKCFVGDICNVCGVGVCEVIITRFYGVCFYDGRYTYPVGDCIAEEDNIVYLGNIHEHPELLV